jgi:Cysteine-rich secretory protein family
MRAIALVGLVACGGDDGAGAGDPSAKQFCVDETNRLRTMNGKPAVVRSAQLEDFADTGAMIDHIGAPHDHFRQTAGGGIAFAENECPKWSLQQQGGGDMTMLVKACIAAFYSEGPGGGHYDNMMGNYASLGCGIYDTSGTVTIIQDFGR